MDAQVKIYSTPTCPYCLRAKAYLKEKNIAFEDIDVSTDPSSAKEMMEKSGQMAVPVLDIEGEIIVGFDKVKISKTLKLE